MAAGGRRDSGLIQDGLGHLTDLFAACETTGTGRMTVDGFARLWTELAFPVTVDHKATVARTFEMLDRDRDGKITCDDFLNNLEVLLAEVNQLADLEGAAADDEPWQDRLNDSFNTHDHYGEGYVDVSAVEDILRDAGIDDIGERSQILSTLHRKGGMVRRKSLVSMVGGR